MSWIKDDNRVLAADPATTAMEGIWNALDEAIEQLNADMPYLPEEMAAQRQALIGQLKQRWESGKPILLPGVFKAAATDGGYSGHTNYETWAMSLWIDNDEGSYNEKREICNNAILADDISEATEAAAATLKGVWEERMPELDGVWADFLQSSFSEIDWYDVVDDDVKEFWNEKQDTELEEGT